MLTKPVTQCAGMALVCAVAFPAGAAADPPQLAASTIATTEAVAQHSSDRDADAKLVEVLVTAQKRQESLQEVPISAQVVGGDVLAEQSHDSLEELVQNVPSVHVTGGGVAGSLTMRGISSGANQAFEQSVGMFIDDIYHGRTRTTAVPFLDLDRVEILKGPQNVFFGNNAIAGAFNIVTKKPGAEWDGFARALYGEFGQYSLSGAAGGPLSSTLGARVAVVAGGQDGWLHRLSGSRRDPSSDDLAGRVSFRFEPNDDFDATLKVEVSDHQDSGIPWQVVNCPTPAGFPGPADYGLSGSCSAALALGVPTGLDAETTGTSTGQRSDLRAYEYVLSADYHKWDHTFSSVSGYYSYDFNLDVDADALPPDLLNGHLPEQYQQFSQELRITSESSGPVAYLAGLYFQTDRLRFKQDSNLLFIGPFLGGPPLGQEVSSAQDEDVYSVFGSVTWTLTDNLKVMGGLRGAWVRKSFDYALLYGGTTQRFGGIEPYAGDLCTETMPATGLQGIVGSIISPACAFNGSKTDHAWTPSANVQYQVDPSVMLYARYDRGFLAGGFNLTDTTGNAGNLPFEAEHVNAYEVGVKSTWFDDRVLLNLAVFRSDYTDLQVTINQIDSGTGNIVSVVNNAAKSRSQGIELEGQFAAGRGLRLQAGVSYLDATYQDYRDGPLSRLQTFCAGAPSDPYCASRYPSGIGAAADLSGTRTQNAPRWSGNAGARYTLSLPNDYELTTEANGIFTSDYYQDIFDEWVGAYVRLDARLSFATSSGSWAVDLIGKNLTDKKIPLVVGGGVTAMTSEHSRNVAAQVRFNW